MARKNDPKIARDGAQQSVWQDVQSADITRNPFHVDLVYDTLIIGAGITGLTAALLLQKAGRQMVVAEAHTPGFGTTGGTSAHINTFADTTYKEAESAFGKDGAQLFADAVNEGFGLIKTNIDSYHIDCDYEVKAGFLYAEDEKQAEQLDDIFEGAQAVKVPVNYSVHVPTPLKFEAALVFEGQAQFHPLKYLLALKKEFVNEGGVLLNNTKIESLEKDEQIHIGVAGGLKVKAKTVIYATHIPPGINSYSLSMRTLPELCPGCKTKVRCLSGCFGL